MAAPLHWSKSLSHNRNFALTTYSHFFYTFKPNDTQPLWFSHSCTVSGVGSSVVLEVIGNAGLVFSTDTRVGQYSNVGSVMSRGNYLLAEN